MCGRMKYTVNGRVQFVDRANDFKRTKGGLLYIELKDGTHKLAEFKENCRAEGDSQRGRTLNDTWNSDPTHPMEYAVVRNVTAVWSYSKTISDNVKSGEWIHGINLLVAYFPRGYKTIGGKSYPMPCVGTITVPETNPELLAMQVTRKNYEVTDADMDKIWRRVALNKAA